MRLYIYGRFNTTGIGRHTENFHRGLIEIANGAYDVVAIDADDQHKVATMLMECAENDAVFFFIFAHPWIVERIKGKRILWFVFESDRLPSKTCELLHDYDAIWVPSAWGRDILRAHGEREEKIRVMPEGVDGKIYFPDPLPHKGFIFLNIGKYEKRKGIDELIDAFIEEFAAEPDAVLWLKADHPSMPERLAQLEAKIAGNGRIKIIGGDYPESDILKLYRCADAFVFPSRAEGFGLPGLEAIACGLPLVALNYSGQSAYLSVIEGLFRPIDYRLVPIKDPDYNYFFETAYGEQDFGRWAEPDIQSLRAGMREIYANIQIWRAKARRAAAIVRSRFSWTDIAKNALTALPDFRFLRAKETKSL